MRITGVKGTRTSEPEVRITMTPDEAYSLWVHTAPPPNADQFLEDFRFDLRRARTQATAYARPDK